MRSQKSKSQIAQAILVGLSIAAVSGPALAAITLPAHSPFAIEQEIAKRPSAVGVTNTTTGEKGCHNETTQTSEPGPCPKDY